MCYLTYKRGFADMIQNLEMGRFSWTIWWAQCNHKGPFKWKSGSGLLERFEEAVLLAFKMEEGATRPGMQTAFRSWIRKGTASPLGSSEEKQSCRHLDFRLLASRTMR